MKKTLMIVILLLFSVIVLSGCANKNTQTDYDELRKNIEEKFGTDNFTIISSIQIFE